MYRTTQVIIKLVISEIIDLVMELGAVGTAGIKILTNVITLITLKYCTNIDISV